MPCPPFRCQAALVNIGAITLYAQKLPSPAMASMAVTKCLCALKATSHALDIMPADGHGSQKHARQRTAALPDQAKPLVASWLDAGASVFACLGSEN
jgi:hypothetical protein